MSEDRGRNRYKIMLVITLAIGIVYFLGMGVRLTIDAFTVAFFSTIGIACIYLAKKARLVDI